MGDVNVALLDRRAVLVAGASGGLALAVAGCGGGALSSPARLATPAATPAAGDRPAWIQVTNLWAARRPERVAFALQAPDASLVAAAALRVRVTDDRGRAVADAPAVFRPLEGPEHAMAAMSPGVPMLDGFYVTTVRFPRAGRFGVVAEGTLADGRPVASAPWTLTVAARPTWPRAGQRAQASVNPLVGAGIDPGVVCSARPACGLHRTVVADALAARQQLVVILASPGLCGYRICNSDALDAVHGEYERRGVRFAHLELFADWRRPNLGASRWFRQWRLPSEPWTFFVGRDGRVVRALEGAATTGEYRGWLDEFASA